MTAASGSQCAPTPLEELHLPARAHNCLKRQGVSTVGDLLARSEQELLRDIPNFGTGCLAEVRAALVPLGLMLRDAP